MSADGENTATFDDWCDLFPKPEPPQSPLPPLPDSVVSIGTDPYGDAALSGELSKIAQTNPTTHNRNQTLHDCWFNLYQLVLAGRLDEQSARQRVVAVSKTTGLPDYEIRTTMRSAEAGVIKTGGARRRHLEVSEPAFVMDGQGNPVEPQQVPDEDEHRPLYADVAAVIDGGLPEGPSPTVLQRTDGVGIFYAGKRNEVYSDPEDGKTMLAHAAGAESLSTGGRYLFIDLDGNGVSETVERSILLGAPEAALKDQEQFRYCSPEDALEVLRVVQDSEQWIPDVVVIDCVGELLPLFGANSDKADDYTNVMARVVKPLTKVGCCVILLDHRAKNAESRAYGSGGTMAKRRAITGTSIGLTPVQQLSPGRGGSVELTVNKDRPGGLRRSCPPARGRRQNAGTFILDPPRPDGRCDWRIVPPLSSASTTFEDQALTYLESARSVTQPFTVEVLAIAIDGQVPPTQSSLQKARRNIGKLVESGQLVEVSGSGRKGRPSTWRVALEEGQPW